MRRSIAKTPNPSRESVAGSGTISYFAVPARQMLHAAKLSFIHPGSNRTVTFEAAIPDDIKEFIAGLMPCIGKGS